MSVISIPQHTYLNLVEANEPVPPVMTNVFPLKASVICIMKYSSLSKASIGLSNQSVIPQPKAGILQPKAGIPQPIVAGILQPKAVVFVPVKGECKGCGFCPR